MDRWRWVLPRWKSATVTTKRCLVAGVALAGMVGAAACRQGSGDAADAVHLPSIGVTLSGTGALVFVLPPCIGDVAQLIVTEETGDERVVLQADSSQHLSEISLEDPPHEFRVTGNADRLRGSTGSAALSVSAFDLTDDGEIRSWGYTSFRTSNLRSGYIWSDDSLRTRERFRATACRSAPMDDDG